MALSPKEFDLLALLADDPGAVVSRQTILEEVWDPHWYGPTKTVDVHVASLRRKLGCPEWILTVRRVGLRLGDTSSLRPEQQHWGNSRRRRDRRGKGAMTRRLVLSYLGLALLILVLLEIPMAVLAARHEHGLTAGQAAREASGLAAVANEDLEHGHLADLTAIMAQYQSRTGEEVAIIDPAGTVIASSDRDHDNDATGAERSLVQAALSGRSVTSFSSDEGQPWAYAAVPISADNQPQGAILLGLAASATEQRIHAIWLALAGFAAGILALTGLVGMLLARSLSRPLARLESAVTRLGEGNLAARADADIGPPEMRSLARQFNHMAGRLSELVDAQSRFVADASHQLRSPLTALRLRLENLEVGSTVLSAEEVAAAGREVQRLSRLVDGLLTLSRADSVEPPRRTIDVEKVIEDRCDAWSALADERQVALVVPDDDRTPQTALLAPGDLDQILDNLLANALDASPEGGRIRVELVGTEPGWLELHVIDEGPGMSENDRRRAFDRFWQGAGTEGGHSGLGLAIVRQLAVRNDASVRAAPRRAQRTRRSAPHPHGAPVRRQTQRQNPPPRSSRSALTAGRAAGRPLQPRQMAAEPMMKRAESGPTTTREGERRAEINRRPPAPHAPGGPARGLPRARTGRPPRPQSEHHPGHQGVHGHVDRGGKVHDHYQRHHGDQQLLGTIEQRALAEQDRQAGIVDVQHRLGHQVGQYLADQRGGGEPRTDVDDAGDGGDDGGRDEKRLG